MVYVTVECMNFSPHEPHIWREGFLWLSKKSCRGMSRTHYDLRMGNKTVKQVREEAGYPVIEEPAPVHKHRLLLHMYPKYPFVHPDKVVTVCSGCGIWFSIDKEGFYNILLDRLYSYTIEEGTGGPLR